MKYLYIPTWAICRVGSPHDTSIFALLPRAAPFPPAPFSLCCWTIFIRRGSCNPGFIHRIPQRSFHPCFYKTNFHRPFIATHSFVRPARLRRLRFAHLGPGCPRVAHNRSLLPVVTVRARNLPRLMCHVKTNYRPPCLLKEKNKSYLLPT